MVVEGKRLPQVSKIGNLILQVPHVQLLDNPGALHEIVLDPETGHLLAQLSNLRLRGPSLLLKPPNFHLGVLQLQLALLDIRGPIPLLPEGLLAHDILEFAAER